MQGYSFLIHIFQSLYFASSTADIERFYLSLVKGLVVFGDSWAPSIMRRGRAPADNSDVLTMFGLVYSGEMASQPLVDDSS